MRLTTIGAGVVRSTACIRSSQANTPHPTTVKNAPLASYCIQDTICPECVIWLAIAG